jgi:hypothetical protein
MIVLGIKSGEFYRAFEQLISYSYGRSFGSEDTSIRPHT